MLLTIFHTPQENIPQLGFCKSSPSKKRVIVIMQEEGQHWAKSGEYESREKRPKAGADYGGLEWPWLVLLVLLLVLVLVLG